MAQKATTCLSSWTFSWVWTSGQKNHETHAENRKPSSPSFFNRFPHAPGDFLLYPLRGPVQRVFSELLESMCFVVPCWFSRSNYHYWAYVFFRGYICQSPRTVNPLPSKPPIQATNWNPDLKGPCSTWLNEPVLDSREVKTTSVGRFLRSRLIPIGVSRSVQGAATPWATMSTMTCCGSSQRKTRG